jgi:cyclic-di-GMP phosphodiesterase, flagellum assembly factor TipF
MPLIAHALFYFAYATVAFAVGLALGRIGGADAAAATLGGLSLFCAMAIVHGSLSVAAASGAIRQTEKKLRAELAGAIESVRASQRETASDIDALAGQMARLEHVASAPAPRIEPPPMRETHMIESLVDKLSAALDARLDDVRRIAGQTAPEAPEQTGTLIQIVRAALQENRIELHLQPIVALPQRRTAFYEGFTRLKDSSGKIILPKDFIPAAETVGMMGLIDNMLLFRCVQIVRRMAKQDRRIGIFCNIAATELADETFFPQFLDFLHENRDLAGSLVFEIAQDAFDKRTAAQARGMARLADLGFRFSIDKVTRLDIDLIDLERSGVRFLKAPARLLIDQLIKEGARPKSNILRELAARDVAAVFRRHGVDLIAERIEDEAAVVEVLELDAPYGQGHLFGAPRAIKDSLMEETAPPPGYFAGRGAVA